MKTIILQDKILQMGKSPIYNEKQEIIGHIHYHFFSTTGKIEITNQDGKLMSTGKMKLFSWLPQWIIEDENGEKKGIIKRKWSFFQKKYQYQSVSGESYQITGNVWNRKFNIKKENGEEIVNISTISSVISLRPHTFLIEVKKEHFDIWEAISLVQGIRSLIKKEKQMNADKD